MRAMSAGRDHIGQWLVGRSIQVMSRSSGIPVTGGTEETVGRAGAIVRAAQNGIVRTYGLFLVFGAVGLALYFLIQQS